jgi:hypothetical protein
VFASLCANIWISVDLLEMFMKSDRILLGTPLFGVIQPFPGVAKVTSKHAHRTPAFAGVSVSGAEMTPMCDNLTQFCAADALTSRRLRP